MKFPNEKRVEVRLCRGCGLWIAQRFGAKRGSLFHSRDDAIRMARVAAHDFECALVIFRSDGTVWRKWQWVDGRLKRVV